MIIYNRFNATKIVYENAALVTLSRADLHQADLREADLRGADLHGADLHGADLIEADLYQADLRGADLRGATMPDGRVFEAYKADPLAGICQDTAARDRAVAAWGKHSWEDCPVHAAMGYNGVDDAPADTRLAVAAFVALFDGLLLPAPRPVAP